MSNYWAQRGRPQTRRGILCFWVVTNWTNQNVDLMVAREAKSKSVDAKSLQDLISGNHDQNWIAIHWLTKRPSKATLLTWLKKKIYMRDGQVQSCSSTARSIFAKFWIFWLQEQSLIRAQIQGDMTAATSKFVVHDYLQPNRLWFFWLVGLSAGLPKNYWTDFHETMKEDEPRIQPR